MYGSVSWIYGLILVRQLDTSWLWKWHANCLKANSAKANSSKTNSAKRKNFAKTTNSAKRKNPAKTTNSAKTKNSSKAELCEEGNTSFHNRHIAERDDPVGKFMTRNIFISSIHLLGTVNNIRNRPWNLSKTKLNEFPVLPVSVWWSKHSWEEQCRLVRTNIICCDSDNSCGNNDRNLITYGTYRYFPCRSKCVLLIGFVIPFPNLRYTTSLSRWSTTLIEGLGSRIKYNCARLSVTTFRWQFSHVHFQNMLSSPDTSKAPCIGPGMWKCWLSVLLLVAPVWYCSINSDGVYYSTPVKFWYNNFT